MVSTGPVTVPPGSSVRSRRLVSPRGWCTVRPRSAHASAASTPAPPALDTIATVRPAGTGWVASSAAVSVSSPKLPAAMTPACSNSAWSVAEFCPLPAAPTVSTGILAPTRRAVRANLRGLPNDSRYSTASLVTSSCSHHISMSLPDTSSLLPTEANEEIPTPSRDSWPARATPTPPDCDMSPATPGRSRLASNVASRPMPGTATPKQSGTDQPHAVPAAHREQVGAGGGVQAGR